MAIASLAAALVLSVSGSARGACRDLDLVPVELLIQSELQTLEFAAAHDPGAAKFDLDAIMTYARGVSSAQELQVVSPRKFHGLLQRYLEDLHSNKRNLDPVQVRRALETLTHVCELARSRRSDGETIDVPALWTEVERRKGILKFSVSFGGTVVFLAAFGLAASLIAGGGASATAKKPRRKRAPTKATTSKAA